METKLFSKNMQITKFIKDVRNEMKYVKWPSTKMILGSTVAVLLISISIGVYLGALDIELKKLLAYLVNKF